MCSCFFCTIGLDDVVDDKELATIARDHLIKWESLSPYLHLSPAQNVEIDRSARDYGMQKRECLLVWSQNLGNKATYRALIQAAEEAKLQKLADKVKDMVTPLSAAGTCTCTCTCTYNYSNTATVEEL